MKAHEDNQPEPIDFSKITIPEHRPEAEIIDDLEKLCSLPGYAHALSFLCWRDNFIGYGEEFVPDDLDKMKSPERLLRSELSFLIGLMVKAPLNIQWPSAGAIQKYIDGTEKLMEELHGAMKCQFWMSVKETGFDPQKENPLSAGKAMREPFFYASEAAFLFQYRDFSIDRYNGDKSWLSKNKGFSPEDVKKVINATSEIQVKKLLALKLQCTPENIDSLTLLPAFTFTAEEISEEAGLTTDRVKNILKAFSLQSVPCNQNFSEVGAYNEISAYPIIPVDGGQYILFQGYSLAESSYETPFFWMSQDQGYAEKAKENRGIFTEKFAAERLKAVLGAERVYTNVEIKKGKNRVGEIDVLAVYADRAVILEAKSKKLTVASRTGSDEHIKKDFEAAVQKAYDQSFRNAEFLMSGEYRLIDENGNTLDIRNDFAEIFIFCVASDYYPALAHQADHFLKTQEHTIIKPPYVMDVFFLDVLCEMLDCPLQFFNYLNRRLRYSKKVKAETELAVLSYHLAYNLWFNDEQDFIDLGVDFSVHVDAAMLSRRDGLPGKTTPEGVLTKLKGTFFDRIIQKISNLEEDNILELGYVLLEISENAAQELSKGCEMILAQSRQDGRPHDLTMGFGHTGITIHSGLQMGREAHQRLYGHCEMAKYRQKADSWFGISLNPECEGLIHMMIGIKSPWEQQKKMDQLLAQFPGPQHKNLKQALHKFGNKKKSKVRRNDPCLCGSGKKDKKCCKNSSK